MREPTTDLSTPALLLRAGQHLTDRFAGVFFPELVDRCLTQAYARLAQTARIQTYLAPMAVHDAGTRLAALARAKGAASAPVRQVLFVDAHDTGPAQIAAGLLAHYAGTAVVTRSAGINPGTAVDPHAVEVLAQHGTEPAGLAPKPVTEEVLRAADWVITLGDPALGTIPLGTAIQHWPVEGLQGGGGGPWWTTWTPGSRTCGWKSPPPPHPLRRAEHRGPEMATAFKTGLRLFVLTTPTAVAVLAVATDTEAVLLLFAVPGAVVGVVLYQDHRRTTGGPTTPGAALGPPGRDSTRPMIVSGPEEPAMDDTTVNWVQARLLRQALEGTRLTPHRLWMHYLGHGGAVGEVELQAYLHELLHLPAVERDRLMHTATALLDPRCHPFLPCTGELLGSEKTQCHRADHQD
ncbi:hypothetical protein GCM10011374_38090 [Kocuria dechangensis]|uniref:Phosphotyrosine protein phosphatase I domain-containing protein n=1 Tax=Kocuria dechangensis TaxID=1176249 RepID=A0A917LZV6_9MICC|nr:low molecular weight phosphatase family protein [Kocuria dechangensis]GGG69937.1 hypothetical protein GCM10011374_38090 [Kocuria dechangensis]